MKSLRLFYLWFGLLAGFAATLVGANDKGFDILITADAIPSPEGFRPKAGKPIHYIFSQARNTLGDAVAGVKLPEPALVESAVVAELKKQGFIRTDVGGPLPEIVILAVVGDANFEQPPLPPNVNPLFEPDFGPYMQMVNIREVLERNLLAGKAPETVEALFPQVGDFPSSSPDINEARDLVVAEAIRIRERGTPRGRDRGKILSLVGADKVERAVSKRTMSTIAAERIVWATRGNQLYVTLSAFDAMRWKQNQRVLLWRTTMLIDWRLDFAKSLGEMLARAGPMFGTDVAVPGFVNTARPEGRVDIGEAKVVAEADAAKESTTSERKK